MSSSSDPDEFFARHLPREESIEELLRKEKPFAHCACVGFALCGYHAVVKAQREDRAFLAALKVRW